MIQISGNEEGDFVTPVISLNESSLTFINDEAFTIALPAILPSAPSIIEATLSMRAATGKSVVEKTIVGIISPPRPRIELIADYNNGTIAVQLFNVTEEDILYLRDVCSALCSTFLRVGGRGDVVEVIDVVRENDIVVRDS